LCCNLVVLETENAHTCMTLAIFTSDTEALNDTKRHISKTNGHIWMQLMSYVIHIGSYQMTYESLL
jgi:hypothetical protein